jgi:hypothetical protein
MISLIVLDEAAAVAPSAAAVLGCARWFPLPAPCRLYGRVASGAIVADKLYVRIVLVKVRISMQLFSRNILHIFGCRREDEREAIDHGVTWPILLSQSTAVYRM